MPRPIWQKKLDNDRAQQLFAKDEISAQDRDLAATALKRSEATFKAASSVYNEAAGRQPQRRYRHRPRQSCQADANLGLSRIDESTPPCVRLLPV